MQPSQPFLLRVERLPRPLCGHDADCRHVAAARAECPICGSFWDIGALVAPPAYDVSYPLARAHFDDEVGRLKVRTLRAWLDELGIALSGRIICETGFGGAHCLRFLHAEAECAFGVEVIPECMEHAAALGLPRPFLLDATALPPDLDRKVDLWIFQDSFEHIPDPASYADWLVRNATPESEIVIVLPEARSTSDRLLRKLWPHRIPDHQFHWSRQGIIEFWMRRDFELVRQFHPGKYVGIGTVVAHARHKLALPPSRSRTGLTLRFNIGEMGLHFRRARR